MLHSIVVRGARVHNLKNVSIDVPHNNLVVFTGLSGSGKSSLAFDTIHAEGQRRFMESLSSFTKQFMENLDKPDVDSIDGLPPTIAIDQRTSSASPRSTVGTATEIYDHLRLLFARVGTPHCPTCDIPIVRLSMQQIIETAKTAIKTRPTHEALFLAPLLQGTKTDLDRIVNELSRIGYTSLRIDGVQYSFHELPSVVDNPKGHTFEVVTSSMLGSQFDNYEPSRLVSSIKNSMELGDGRMKLLFSGTGEEFSFTTNLICTQCGIAVPDIEPRHFSFNNPLGACSACTGLGYLLKFDPELLIPNKKLTIAQGAIQPLTKIFANSTNYLAHLEEASTRGHLSLNTPLQDFTAKQLDFLLYGKGDKPKKGQEPFKGIVTFLEEKYRDTDSEYLQKELEDYMRIFKCTDCNGKRLKKEFLAVKVAGKTIDEVVALSITKLIAFFSDLEKESNELLDDREKKISLPIIKEVVRRSLALGDVGLSYLILDRSMATLSGGEAQRIKLGNQITSSLVGVVYVLDEPSIGLHPKDTEHLIETLKKLRDSGNTVLVVEHDKAIMMMADMLVDVGPGAGKNGGQVIFAGKPQDILKSKKSLTGRYLSGELTIPTPKKHRTGSGKSIDIIGASEFNLKNVDTSIPLGKMVCVSGLSGSGKSTLIIDILSKALRKHFYHTKENPGTHKEIRGIEHIDKVIDIDQSPIGRTPRSNPATYTNIFTPIRELFTELPEAKIKGFKPGHFSFNVKGGRCETCQGEGMVRIDMRFLSDVYVECRDCRGKRYNKEALEVHYEGYSIADVLSMTVDEAVQFFSKHTTIHEKLKTLSDVGLGYIQLGQPANTLSGGEAQRIKLATELSRRSTGKTLYILDEPTTGLHFEDIKRLLHILNQLVEKGNTVLIIEHNLDVIRTSDWVIDLGPEGGDKGGYIVAEGTPEDIMKVKESWTGKYLAMEK